MYNVICKVLTKPKGGGKDDTDYCGKTQPCQKYYGGN
jgi:hypothetical protein